MKVLFLAMTLTLQAAQPAPAPTDRDEPSLLIDSQSLASLAQVWDIIADDTNPVWPGWNAENTPVLVYFPGVQDVLLNHESPPDGFSPAGDLMPFEHPVFANAFIRNGETVYAHDGQNTAAEINGVQTLIVADPASNLRNSLRGLIFSGQTSDIQSEALSFEMLTPQPFQLMGMAAHEAFHVYQAAMAPDKQANEMLLTRYPVLSEINNLGVALEAQTLADALRAETRSEAAELARQALALREWRRASLPPDVIAYEDGIEFGEGLAKYIEYALTFALEAAEPRAEMRWVRGFSGFASMEAEREALRTELVRVATGEMVINNDPFGTAPVRFRNYYSGMAVAALLDRLGSEDWHSRILEPDTTLTGLLTEALGAYDREPYLDAALSSDTAAEQRSRVAQLARDGADFNTSVLATILDDAAHEAESWRIVLDYSGISDARTAFGFSPFGIIGLDENRIIYRTIPVSGAISGGNSFQQFTPTPLLHDRANRQITFRVPGAPPAALVSGSDITGNPGWDSVGLEIGEARLSVEDGVVTLHLTRPAE